MWDAKRIRAPTTDATCAVCPEFSAGRGLTSAFTMEAEARPGELAELSPWGDLEAYLAWARQPWWG